jgi:hypothetical protein
VQKKSHTGDQEIYVEGDKNQVPRKDNYGGGGQPLEDCGHLKVPSHGKVFRSLLKAHLAEAGRLRQSSRWLYSCITDSAG